MKQLSPKQWQKFVCTKLIVIITCAAIIGLLGVKLEAFETYTAHGGPVKDFDLSPNAANIASASYDYSIVLWNARTLSPLKRLIGHDAAVVAVTFSPDERFLVPGGDDYKALVWDLSKVASKQP